MLGLRSKGSKFFCDLYNWCCGSSSLIDIQVYRQTDSQSNCLCMCTQGNKDQYENLSYVVYTYVRSTTHDYMQEKITHISYWFGHAHIEFVGCVWWVHLTSETSTSCFFSPKKKGSSRRGHSQRSWLQFHWGPCFPLWLRGSHSCVQTIDCWVHS